MSFRTPLGDARGLGSARAGTHHWWMQHLTALALIPLTVWFAIAVIAISGADHAGFTAWLGNAINAGLLILIIIFTFHHAQLGLQVVIEDYVHAAGAKIASVLAVRALAIILGLAAILAVLRIWLGGGA